MAVRLPTVLIVLAFSAMTVVGCKKPDGTAPAAAPVAPAVVGVGSDQLAQAKLMIDDMAHLAEQFNTDIEGSADSGKARQFRDRFLAASEAMKAKGTEIDKKLTDDERKQLQDYSRERMQPVVGRLLQALGKAEREGLLQESAPGPAGVTPAAAEPVGGVALPGVATPAP
ncbi:MAG: hypothetical protein EXR79_00700 [Myxococcales bacterium]|nr:hypothetical protein [Myxococcales bacterium]